MGLGQDPSLTLLIAFLIFIFIAAGVTLVLWMAMPFSLFGVKGLLGRLIEEQERTNRLLESVRDSLERSRREGPWFREGSRGAGDEDEGPEV